MSAKFEHIFQCNLFVNLQQQLTISKLVALPKAIRHSQSSVQLAANNKAAIVSILQDSLDIDKNQQVYALFNEGVIYERVHLIYYGWSM